MTTAYVFPGQGSQSPGMGRAFYRAWPDTAERFDGLDAAADADLRDLCFDETSEALRRTANTQPAVFATSLAAYAGVDARVGPPAYVAGHSLGHVTAAVAAGAHSGDAGVELVACRGDLMDRAARADGPGTMISVLLADPDTVAAVCDRYDGVGVAAFNGPRHTVVSGHTDAVERVRADLEDRGGVRVRDLDVGAAFHSSVMASATEPFGVALDDAPFGPASVPICSDVTGTVYTDPAVARRDLAAQLTSPIDWVRVVETLVDRGVTQFVELPPAGTLAGLIERITPAATVVALEAPADIEEVRTTDG